MKKIFAGLVLALALGLTACTTSQPVAINGPIGSKVAEAESATVCGLVWWGDASVLAAAKAGNIKEVTTVDQRITNILGGLYIKTVTVVSGE